MKNILVIYPDECCLDIRQNGRQTHYDVSIIHFFDRLRAEKNEKLSFLKADGKNLHETSLDQFGCSRFDLIITYPAFPRD